MADFTDIENLNKTISGNLKRMRGERGLTLDELAEMSGVSKSMLGQIERGESNPSVATLWKISAALKISFTALMVDEKTEAEIVNDREAKPLMNEDKHFQLYPIFPYEPGYNFEILHLDVEPGAKSMSEPHEAGAEEYVMVSKGVFTLYANEKYYDIPAGHSIRYRADQAHGYLNKTDELTEAYMIIYYKGR